ncbi:Transcriptional regulator of nonfermentable carbon utilization [Dimargaris xerosporica]|nr:Transcriptional regulator of nonfermentable carbon utilization [Dimargaris xerosporica]
MAHNPPYPGQSQGLNGHSGGNPSQPSDADANQPSQTSPNLSLSDPSSALTSPDRMHFAPYTLPSQRDPSGEHTPNDPQGHAKSSSHPSASRSRRRKATRACYHCQRAHLTCDDGRPCQRCVKRGLAATCKDGYRKTAKYLLEDDFEQAPTPPQPLTSPTMAATATTSTPGSNPHESAAAAGSSSTLLGNPTTSSLSSFPSPTGGIASLSMATTPSVPSSMADSAAMGPSANQASSLVSNSGQILNNTMGQSDFNANPLVTSLVDNPSLLPLPLNSNYGFGSESANLEYNMLNAILNNSLFNPVLQPQTQQQPSSNIASGLPGMDMADVPWHNINVGGNQLGSAGYPAPPTVVNQPGPNRDSSNSAITNNPTQSTSPLAFASNSSSALTSPVLGLDASAASIATPPYSVAPGQQGSPGTNGGGTLQASPYFNPGLQHGVPTAHSNGLPTYQSINAGMHASPAMAYITPNGTYRTSGDVYKHVQEPFRYADGFHFLMGLVTDRLSKEDAIRICRAMAQFRPTFIALNMNLTTDDLIFMEKCFHRTLLELEKLISYSGTPTVVWRRTGEIALVGKEFAMLTGWSKEQLLGVDPSTRADRQKVALSQSVGTSTNGNLPSDGATNAAAPMSSPAPHQAASHRYIFEFMDNPSIVDYWEKFADHAYGDSEHAVLTTCQLLRPDQRKIPCTFCFTIKRDIFDIPLVVIGNFLPILS